MRLKVIACKVLYREISLLSANSEHIIDVSYLRQGFHDQPQYLNELLQNEIDRIDRCEDVYSYASDDEEQDFDAILLGYGLCSNAVTGLHSERYKLVIPRAHDCATLLLGSKEAYRQIFDSASGGIYWYSAGWNENAVMPSRGRVEKLRVEYEEKYGEDNAEYLMEMEQNWLKEYKSCTFIDWPALHNDKQIAFTKDCAEYLDWEYRQLPGDDSLLRAFLSGEWDDERFLVVEPGRRIAQSYDAGVLGIAKDEESSIME